MGRHEIIKLRPISAEDGLPVFYIVGQPASKVFNLWRNKGASLNHPKGPHFVGFFGSDRMNGHIARGEYGRSILLVGCRDGESDFENRMGMANVIVNRFARFRLSVKMNNHMDTIWASISKDLTMEDLYLCGLKPGQFERRQAEFERSKNKGADSDEAAKINNLN